MKTARDIKSSLEIGRTQKVPSRTRFIEDKLRKELEDELGAILDEDERAEMEEKEVRRIDAHNLALKRSQMKILMQKEKAKVVQGIRSGKEGREENVGRRAKKVTTPKPSEKKGFNEIELEY